MWMGKWRNRLEGVAELGQMSPSCPLKRRLLSGEGTVEQGDPEVDLEVEVEVEVEVDEELHMRRIGQEEVTVEIRLEGPRLTGIPDVQC